MAHRLRCLVAASALALLAAPGLAQKKAQKKTGQESWQVDPYTKGDPEAMQRAGYVSFGPFDLGDDHGSAAIHKMMPETRILWVETAHFRIGSSLWGLNISKAAKSKRLVAKELAALQKRLPGIKPSTKKLDRWLRLHLYAHRLEKLYGDMQKILGVTDASFPKKGGRQRIERDPKFMGRGFYMGMPDKYVILLFNKTSNLSRYGVKAGLSMPKDPKPISLFFIKRGSLLFGTCTHLVYDWKDPDYRLYCHVMFHTAENLSKGYKFYGHVLPAWLQHGLSNSIIRSFDPEEHEVAGMKNWEKTKAYPKNWQVLSRRLVKSGYAPSAADLCVKQHTGELGLNDFMCSWSRVDFLRQLDGGKKFAKFMALMKAPKPHEPGVVPTFEVILQGQKQALSEAFGMDFAAFDKAWKAYVLKKYKRK